MANQDNNKFIKNTTFPEHEKRAKNLDPKTNNRKTSNKNPGATGREI